MTRGRTLFLASAAIGLLAALPSPGDARSGEATARSSPDTGPSASRECAALAGLPVPGGKIIGADQYAAGSTLVGGVMAGTVVSTSLCRVRMSLTPAPGSTIAVEVWLPDQWNNNLMGLGGGGFDGALSPAGEGSLKNAVAQGYTVVATDAGHTPAPSVGSWAHLQPGRIVDFGHRANHLGANAAKQIITAYYGANARLAIFNGCSNGGRDGIALASRYPKDYDAIVAGAPAIRYTEAVTQLIWYSEAAKAFGSPANAAAKTRLVHDAVIRSCDKNDGVEDGLIENPRACHFKPRDLVCKPGVTAGCLHPGEASAFERIYGGMRWSNGLKIIDGPAIGSEGAPGNWEAWITGPVPAIAGQEFYRWFVYDDPNWSVANFQMDRDYGTARSRIVPVINTEYPDLRAFTKRGGRLIIYQGWDDPVVTPETTIRYVESMHKAVGPKSANQVRLFMVPGMAHCGGGPGATSFDMQSALEDWTRRGVAPTRIVATKTDLPTGSAPFSRPLCAWPKIARYNGKGSTRDAANFSCVLPNRSGG